MAAGATTTNEVVRAVRVVRFGLVCGSGPDSPITMQDMTTMTVLPHAVETEILTPEASRYLHKMASE